VTTLVISKGIMDTPIERIHAKIAELEAKIADLRIAEREIQALDKRPEPKTSVAPTPKPRQKPGPKAVLGPTLRGRPKASGGGAAPQTIGAAIAGVLDQHGALSVAEIVEHINAAGRDITNRSVSFTLQSLKKRGLVKSADGKWQPGKTRSRRVPTLPAGRAQETGPAA
jgi:hypothetical protein